MSGYTYSEFVTAVATQMATDSSDPSFIVIIPRMIDYAEGRIYRDIEPLNEIVRDASGALSANSRDFTLPTASGIFRVVQSINLITPAGTAPNSGTRNPLLLVSRDVVDTLWPAAASSTGVPQVYAHIDGSSIIVGPSSNGAYKLEVIGVIRPAPLSESNTSTYLSSEYPEFFFAAAMVFASGYQKNFGAQADDPKMAQSWEGQYQLLKGPTLAQELRRKGQKRTIPEQLEQPS